MQSAGVVGLVALAVGAGFLLGFAWGQGTREALPGAMSSSYRDGKLTVTVDARQALSQGLTSLFQ